MRLAALLLCSLSALLRAAEPPELTRRDIVNAADRSSNGVAPGEIVVLFPTNAGPAVLAPFQLADGMVANTLAETRVWFDGISAPINYSIKGQVGTVVPYEVAGHKTTQVVVEYQGVRSAAVTLPVFATSPALFTLDSSGRGQAAMLNETGCCNSVRNPAARGEWSAIYATGEGQTNPPGVTGLVSAYANAAEYPVPRRRVRVTPGGVPAEILWVGEAPHTVTGLLQVNFRVPATATVGDAVPLVLWIGDTRSSDAVTMAIRSARRRVLVLDENAARLEWLRKLLAEAGYLVLAVRSVEAAAGQAAGHPVDMIVSGLSISTDRRRELIAQFRDARPQLKIAALAKALDPETLRTADLLGAHVIFTQTTAPGLILQRVAELLKTRSTPYVTGQSPVSLNRNIRR